jgi:RNA polymerase sigma-70 factor (ECF subfamily)
VAAGSFDGLVSAHAGELLAFLQRMLGDRQEAEDVLQDSFLRAYRAFPRLQSGANHRAWLYRIALNAARTRLARRRTPPLVSDEIDDVAEDQPSAEERQVSVETAAAVRRAVDGLPRRQRAALILRMYQDLEYTAIGEVLGCSAQAARAHVYQAVKKLRARFAVEAGGGRRP